MEGRGGCVGGRGGLSPNFSASQLGMDCCLGCQSTCHSMIFRQTMATLGLVNCWHTQKPFGPQPAMLNGTDKSDHKNRANN